MPRSGLIPTKTLGESPRGTLVSSAVIVAAGMSTRSGRPSSTRHCRKRKTRVHLSRLLMIDAAVRAHDGNPDGALESCSAILGAGRSIGDEPFLIGALVRIAIGSVGLRSARRVVGQTAPSEPALERIQHELTDEMAQQILVAPTARGERAAYVELIAPCRAWRAADEPPLSGDLKA